MHSYLRATLLGILLFDSTLYEPHTVSPTLNRGLGQGSRISVPTFLFNDIVALMSGDLHRGMGRDLPRRLT